MISDNLSYFKNNNSINPQPNGLETYIKNSVFGGYKNPFSDYKPKLQEPLREDKVEFTKDTSKNNISKEKLSKEIKRELLWEAGMIAALGICAASGIMKPKISIKKLGKNIQFTPAQTLKEAIEFGKKKLKIQEYIGFDDVNENVQRNLDVINWINEGITKAANKHQGRIRMPDKVVFAEAQKDNTIAWVKSKLEGYSYMFETYGSLEGTLGINKSILGNIDEALTKDIDLFESTKTLLVGKTSTIASSLYNRDDLRKVGEKIRDFRAGNLDFNKKVELFETLSEMGDIINYINKAPIQVLKHTIQPIDNSVDAKFIADLSKKSLAEQKAETLKIIKRNLASETFKGFDIKPSSPFRTLFHEFGHLQDTTTRVPAEGMYNEAKEYPHKLKKWLNNKNNMQIANSISLYAHTGPGEFVAEVYARLIEGRDLSDDVMKLYKKLRGPKIPHLS